MSDKLPPHDELAEASVIASAISDADALAKVIRLRRDHFYLVAHQTLTGVPGTQNAPWL